MNPIALLLTLSLVKQASTTLAAVTSPGIVYSPYNWYLSGAAYAQSSNPGAYLKLGFTGTQIGIAIDVSPLVEAKIPPAQYPVVRYSVDGGRPTTLQLDPATRSISCAHGLAKGVHQLTLKYVAGYVFVDFWTPINVLRVTGFSLDENASIVPPSGSGQKEKANALFLGDSITNGDDDVATFSGGITNSVDTQDATLGYPNVVASGLGAEFGIVAYGGASWDHTAADGHTPGLMTSYAMIDSIHSRLIAGKLRPSPDDIFVNMGENSPPSGDDVPKLLSALRAAGNARTNIFLIVPFSGRSRAQLTAGLNSYLAESSGQEPTYLLDLGNSPFLLDAGSTMLSVDGQHPLASHHALLGAKLLVALERKLSGR